MTIGTLSPCSARLAIEPVHVGHETSSIGTRGQAFDGMRGTPLASEVSARQPARRINNSRTATMSSSTTCTTGVASSWREADG
jgi:hypothetical protein